MKWIALTLLMTMVWNTAHAEDEPKVAFVVIDPEAVKIDVAKKYPTIEKLKNDPTKRQIELLGSYSLKDGWTILSCFIDYYDESTLQQSFVTKMDFKDGKWGKLDKKTKKIVPVTFNMPLGKYEVHPSFMLKQVKPDGTSRILKVYVKVPELYPLEVK